MCHVLSIVTGETVKNKTEPMLSRNSHSSGTDRSPSPKKIQVKVTMRQVVIPAVEKNMAGKGDGSI